MDTYLEFASNHTLLVSALLFSFLLVLFTELRRKAAGMINVDPVHAVRLINDDAAVVDIRSTEAFARGHIVNAKNMPLDQLSSYKDKLDNLKTRPVIAVCDSGVTSTRAVNELRKMGIETAFGLKGGMNAWTQAGLPIVSAKKIKKRKD